MGDYATTPPQDSFNDEEMIKKSLRSFETSEILNKYRIPVRPVPQPISRKDIYQLGVESRDDTRLLLFLLYLTGGRINEVLELRPCDFEMVQIGKFSGKIVVCKLKTLKNRRLGYRDIPIPYGVVLAEHETKMLDYINGYADMLNLKNDERFCDYSSVWGWMKISKLSFNLIVDIWDREGHRSRKIINDFHLFPHFMRHCRLTHLVSIYHFDALRLMHFAGWSSTLPARNYVHLNWDSMAESFINL